MIMKTKLLRELRQKAAQTYQVYRDRRGKYIIKNAFYIGQGYYIWSKVEEYDTFQEAKENCDALRRDYILGSLGHKYVY